MTVLRARLSAGRHRDMRDQPSAYGSSTVTGQSPPASHFGLTDRCRFSAMTPVSSDPPPLTPAARPQGDPWETSKHGPAAWDHFCDVHEAASLPGPRRPSRRCCWRRRLRVPRPGRRLPMPARGDRVVPRELAAAGQAGAFLPVSPVDEPNAGAGDAGRRRAARRRPRRRAHAGAVRRRASRPDSSRCASLPRATSNTRCPSARRRRFAAPNDPLYCSVRRCRPLGRPGGRPVVPARAVGRSAVVAQRRSGVAIHHRQLGHRGGGDRHGRAFRSSRISRAWLPAAICCRATT